MSRSVLVAFIVTAFCVTISISNPISSDNDEDSEVTLQELQVATIEALVAAFIGDIQKEDLAKVTAVNPATFRCSKSSPTGPSVWSNTKPEVALTHIFCGQINCQGQAEGYHSRPNNRDAVCARANNLVQNTFPLNCYKKIEVLQTFNGLFRQKWIARAPGTYCFFPPKWNIVDTVKVLVDIYNRCQNQRDPDKICYANYRNRKFGIVVFITKVNGRDAINSAFPVPNNMGMPCGRQCTATLAPDLP